MLLSARKAVTSEEVGRIPAVSRNSLRRKTSSVQEVLAGIPRPESFLNTASSTGLMTLGKDAMGIGFL